MKNAFKLFDYQGTPVYLKYWFFILFLFLSFKTVLALFIAILIHELAHTFVAKKLGYSATSVFIDIFHGGALIDSRYENNHNDGIKIVAAGPISNILLTLISYSAMLITVNDIVYEFMATFTVVNIVLAIFNLLPIYPLDGGRITKFFLQKSFGERGKRYNGIISICFAVILLLYAITNFDWILMFFSIIFIIFSYNELKPIDIN